jgi:hypothetical protein
VQQISRIKFQIDFQRGFLGSDTKYGNEQGLSKNHVKDWISLVLFSPWLFTTQVIRNVVGSFFY